MHLRLSNGGYIGTSSALTVALLWLLVSWVAQAETRYVWINSPNPSAPYTNWETAAQNIQAAVDAAQAGDIVLVTNGMYNTGGKAVYGTMTNRVAIDKAITVQSVNGSDVTWIVGTPAPGTTNCGDGAIRCAYVGTNAVLAGFSLTNGFTRNSGNESREQNGGGVWSESSGLVTSITMLS
ncbi:MAG: hypothetical protein WCO56_26420 [Verrucomicrobiota bacterium]